MTIKLFKQIYQLAWLAVLIIGTADFAWAEGEVNSDQSVAIPDPIFSVEYDSRYVHFESIETKRLLPDCHKMLSDINPLPPVLTLYAEYSNGSKRIYIVGESDNEKIIVLHDNDCDSGIPLLSILQRHHNPKLVSDGPVLTDLEVTSLIKDTLARHAKAFGSKDAFLKWLDAKSEEVRSGCQGRAEVWCPPTYHTLQPFLQEELQKYRKD